MHSMNTLCALVLAVFATDDPSETRARAARELAEALARSGEGAPSLATLDAAVDTARATLGADSEVAAELGRLVRGARFEGLMAGNDGAVWLAELLTEVVSDLRFEPVREADLPEGFPEPTPVGEIVLQSYPAYRMARTSMNGEGGNGAFWKLFGHIQENEIAMTAPVETTFDMDGGAPAEATQAFLYGSRTLGETGAKGPVEVVDAAPSTVVSIGLRGYERRERIERARDKLERWIANKPGWRAAGPLRTMGWNSPMVPADRRYFEVQIPVTNAAETVIDFSDPSEADRWQIVDDVVMGGRSSSRMVATADGTSVFRGDLSVENNGGFASVRTTGERCSLAGATAVVLRVRGDGQAYKLRLRTDALWDGASYQTTFETRAGEWMDVTLDLADFEPRWRGRLVRDAPPLDPAAVRGLGLMIADKQEGAFRLELRSLAKLPTAGE